MVVKGKESAAVAKSHDGAYKLFNVKFRGNVEFVRNVFAVFLALAYAFRK